MYAMTLQWQVADYEFSSHFHAGIIWMAFPSFSNLLSSSLVMMSRLSHPVVADASSNIRNLS
jgi:hypothetical protein